jgi:hypothetical protein
LKRRTGFGYQAPPKAHAKEIAAAYGARERADSIARDKAERSEDYLPLPDGVRHVSLAERTVNRRQTLGPGLDLDAQIARDKAAALAKPNSAQFIEHLMADLGLSETAARLYALALRSVEVPELRSQMVTLADPVTDGRPTESTSRLRLPAPAAPPLARRTTIPINSPRSLSLAYPLRHG